MFGKLLMHHNQHISIYLLVSTKKKEKRKAHHSLRVWGKDIYSGAGPWTFSCGASSSKILQHRRQAHRAPLASSPVSFSLKFPDSSTSAIINPCRHYNGRRTGLQPPAAAKHTLHRPMTITNSGTFCPPSAISCLPPPSK